MGWIGISDLYEAQLRVCPDMQSDTRKLLSRGSLLVEFEYVSPPDGGTTLVDFSAAEGWARRLKLHLGADNRLMLVQTQEDADSRCVIALSLPPTLGPGRLRATFSWDAACGTARLSLEGEALDAPMIQIADNPFPMPVSDLVLLTRAGRRYCAGPVRVLAFADQVCPVPLPAGLHEGALVRTQSGYVPVQELNVGDRVVTGSGFTLPVRHLVRQSLPMVGLSRAIRLRAPYFGLQDDLICAPNYKLLLSDERAEYMFGREKLFVEARFLLGHRGVEELRCLRSANWVHIVLDRHADLNVAGMWAESLCIGDMLSSETLHASSPLAHIPPAFLPLGGVPCHPTLNAFEARGLALMDVA